jgi:RNA polymerase sigma factor (sigma-70 family)
LAVDGEARERALLKQVRQGDTAALGNLLNPHDAVLRGRIKEVVSAKLMRRLSISDILQETWITAHHRIGEFEHRRAGSLRNWLIAIAERKARRAVQWHVAVAMRSQKREVTRGQRLPTGQFVGGALTASEVAMAAEFENLARQALETLPEDYQEILRLCREEGLAFPQAAERMGRSYEATKKLYGRALARFSLVLGRLKGTTHGN